MIRVLIALLAILTGHNLLKTHTLPIAATLELGQRVLVVECAEHGRLTFVDDTHGAGWANALQAARRHADECA